MESPDQNQLIDIISRFDGIPILVVGDMVLDRFIWGKVERISPEAPVPVVEITHETVHLGGAANVAANLVSLGARPLPVGIVGTDEAGNTLMEEFRRQGIETTGIVTPDLRATTVKTRIIAQHQQVCRADRENRAPVTGETLETVLGLSAKMVKRSQAVVLSDYRKGLLVPALIDFIGKECRRWGRFLAVDPKAKDFRIYSGASIVTPNKREAEEASGIGITDGESVITAGRRLLEVTGADYVLVTRGEEGMTLVEREGHLHLPTAAREVFDVTGAGDTVVATLTLAIAAGATVREAAYLANHAAGIVVGKLGTASATRAELFESLAAGRSTGD